MNLYQKLNKIQSSVRGLGKDKKQKTYDYVSESKVLEHIKPLMEELGLILNTEVTDVTNQRIDYATSNGAKSAMYNRIKMRFTWIDCESGETLSSEWAGTGMNDWDKGYGSAITYGHRYYLLKFFHIATDADDVDALTDEAHTGDTVAIAPPQPAPAPAPLIDPEQLYRDQKESIFAELATIKDPKAIKPWRLQKQALLRPEDHKALQAACLLRGEELTKQQQQQQQQN